MAKTFTRRRTIGIFAAAAGLPLLCSGRSAASRGTATEWTGQALGAPAKLILNHPDPAAAQRLIDAIVVEVDRLEGIFSLYRDPSSLTELNRVGGLAAPPTEMLALLSSCARFWEVTGGVFDPTVQPLWQLYRQHFATHVTDERGPDAKLMREYLSRVGFAAVKFGPSRITFERPKMAMTLNGVAQGFITDRVVDILRNAGVDNSLVDMGEDRAIGSQPDGAPWRIGLATEEDSSEPDTTLSVVNRAIATSSPTGYIFDQAGKFGHILHPREGSVAQLYRRVSVIADDAATADALSTAFNLMEADRIAAALEAYPTVSVDLVDLAGNRWRFGANLENPA